MRLNNYTTLLNAEKVPVLVKEHGYNYSADKHIDTPEKVADLMNNAYSLNRKTEEQVYMLACNTKISVIGVFDISKGTVNAVIVKPREIFMRALLCGAVGIFIVHNHPSGESTPSREDVELTKRISEAGKLIGINLLDHVIVGEGYFSFKENDML